MGRLSFTANISLDGYINDANGSIDWGSISDEVHQFFNDLERQNGIYLYGRRLYETMAVWEDLPPTSPVMDQYGEIWRDADKIVFSSTLPEVSTARTTLERAFFPDYVAELKRSSSENITIGGPTLAAQAFDLIDDLHLVLHPVVLGGGTKFFPSATARFALADSRVFGNGVVHLHYRKDS